jgi:thiamine-monophosphate kinase
MEESDYHFPPLGEFQFVRQVLSGACPPGKEVPSSRFWLGAGDDCAAFDGWLVTKDLSVENTHFRLDWATPEQAVEKSIVSNVSDISAMGGTPHIALLGICHNKAWNKEIRDRIAAAFAAGFASRHIALIGGDTVAGECGMFSITLLGTCEGKPLCRNGAKPGDSIYVTGTLGKSAAGLWALQNGYAADVSWASLLDYHLAPTINENVGSHLLRLGIGGACIDISDGLSSELHHIALSSGVRLSIEEEKIPIDQKVSELASYYGVSPKNFWLEGGEEYQLLFTSSLPDSIFYQELEACAITRIGTVYSGSGVEMFRLSGGVEKIYAKSWSHL